MHARGSSIIVPTVCVEPGASSAQTRSVSSRSRRSSSAKPTSGCMISTSGASPVRLLDRERGAGDRADLHLVDLRVHEPEPAAARAEHRVRLVQRADPGAHRLVGRLLLGRQELVQRRVEQPDRHRQAGHRLEDALEVGLLERQQPVERGAAAGLVSARIISCIDRQPLLAEEHVLGAAEADALGAELARPRRVGAACRRSRAPSAGGSSSAQPSTVSKSSFSCGGTSSIAPRIDARRCRRRS